MEPDLHLPDPAEDFGSVAYVLEAIDRLIDAMEGLDAPVTRELLASAMMALVHECNIRAAPARLN